MADLASRITQPGVQASEPVAVEAEKPAEEASKLLENNYDVEVQLSDIQNNTDNPLGSVHTFDELGL